MNKKISSVVTVLVASSVFLCSCGNSASSAPVPTTQVASTEQEESTRINVSTTSEPTTEDPMTTSEPVTEPTPKVDVEWQTLTYQWEGDSGYKFEATVKVSPWINTKNEDYVNAAWDEVSNGKTLPYFDPNEQGYWNGKCGFDGITDLTDMYYCIGEVSIKNVTSGWNITSDNPITSETVCLSPVQKPGNNPIADCNSRTIAKVVYGNETRSDYTWAIVSPNLQSDNWGPVPFVFAHYDRKTPKYPDGEYLSEMADRVFCISDTYYGKAHSVSTKISLIEEKN